MGFRFKKRIKIMKGVYLNVGKKGTSVSVGGKGLTVNSSGRVTASIPGTGISYSNNLTTSKKSTVKSVNNSRIDLMEDRNYPYIEVNTQSTNFDDVDELTDHVVDSKFRFLHKPHPPLSKIGIAFAALLFFISLPTEGIYAVGGLIAIIYLYKYLKIQSSQKKVNEEKADYRKYWNYVRENLEEMIEQYNFSDVVYIVTKNLWVDETKEQLIESLGDPVKITNKTTKTKITEYYHYNQINARSFGLIVTLEDDIVVGWETK